MGKNQKEPNPLYQTVYATVDFQQHSLQSHTKCAKCKHSLHHTRHKKKKKSILNTPFINFHSESNAQNILNKMSLKILSASTEF